jgi:uncharacterized protein (DUF1501 family)
VALASLLEPELFAGSGEGPVLSAPHFRPKAKRVIHLIMAGAPSQIDSFDYKPRLRDMYNEDLPPSVIDGQRFTTMTSGQARFPIAPSIYDFKQYGQSGAWVSDLFPHMAKMVDEISFIRSVHTEAINHDPAITFLQTGSEVPGRAGLGAWLSYGLGSMNKDLPSFVVMTPTWTGRQEAQALYSRLWGSGWLPPHHQGVSLRSNGDPVLYLNNPKGVTSTSRRAMLDGLAALNQEQFDTHGDPETLARIAQYEMAYRMQTSVPELTDISDEPQSVLDLYGPDVKKPGTFAASVLLARRMVERDVRFIQIYHRGWDQHGNLTTDMPNNCRDVDQPCAGLLRDLEQRGLLEDTIVVWGAEFGRTVYCQGALSKTNYGRDHHPRCFTYWMAGGGIRGGTVHGETDDFSYNITKDPVHIHDLNATILHCLGIDHERLVHRFKGRDFRLTDVHGKVVREILA